MRKEYYNDIELHEKYYNININENNMILMEN